MTSATGSGQLPLALRYPPDQRFDTWVDTSADALLALRALARAPSMQRVYLAGPAGAGKTHLALATCAEAEAAGQSTAYVALAQVAGHAQAALEGLHHADLVALDGLEAVAGSAVDEAALFAFHNRMHDAGRAVLYVARAWPEDLGIALPDLRSRLGQSLRFALPALDDAQRAQLLRLRAQRRGLQFDEAAIDWLLRRVDRDPVQLARLFERIDAAALAAQRRLTVPFVREVLEMARPDAADPLS